MRYSPHPLTSNTSISGGDLGRWREGWIGQLVVPILENQNNEKREVEENCECHGRSKGKRTGQVPHCIFYLVALLVCNSQIVCPIDYATPNKVPGVLILKKKKHARYSKLKGASSRFTNLVKLSINLLHP